MKFQKCTILGISFLLILLGTACSKQNGKENDLYINETEIASGDFSTKGLEEEPLDLENYKLDDNTATEFLWNAGASVENGYYYMLEGYLYFYDKESEQTVLVCNRADCMHEEEMCNASFSFREGFDYVLDGIASDGDWLYMLAANENEGYMNLCRISMDGSTREDSYMTLYREEMYDKDGNGQFSYPDYCIHKGYIYYTIRNEAIPKIRRMKLGGIFAYNTITGEISLVKADIISTYDIQNEHIFYREGTAIYGCSLRDYTEIKIKLQQEEENPEFIVRDQTLYVMNYNTGILSAYNMDGKKINSTSGQEVDVWFGGDDENILGYYLQNGNVNMVILNLEDFLLGDGKWKRLE